MGKYAELVCVTGQNNNKYYKMQENDDGTFTARWGRVGGNESAKTFPMSEWDKRYNNKANKVRNGYKYTDVTALRADIKQKEFKDCTDSDIQFLLNTLERYSKNSIKENYTVSSENVTKAQVDHAQNIINNISEGIKKEIDKDFVNENLEKLYITIPRKMKKVQDHLLQDGFKKKDLSKILKEEQDLLDVMSQQVSMQATSADDSEPATMEDALGIKIEKISKKEIEQIKELMGSESDKFKRAFKVINKKTQEKYDKQRKESVKHWEKLLWHGSRNENWLNIMQTGLVLRPSSAVITGKMFGYGIYYADKCRKSLGYTSLRGSYWASGNANQGFMALFSVNTGKELRVQQHNSWMYDLNEEKLKAKGDYDSLFAKGGVDLRNNEYIVYNQNQCTIKYIVEIG